MRKVIYAISLVFLFNLFVVANGFTQSEEQYDSIIKNALDKIERANKERDRKLRIADDDFVDEREVVKEEYFPLNALTDNEILEADGNIESDFILDRDVQEERIGELLDTTEKATAETEVFEAKDLNMSIIDVLDVEDMDVRDVIEIISVKSDLTIITDPSIEGNITISLRNTKARDALRIVLEENGYAFYEEYDIIYVMSAEQYLQEYGISFSDSEKSQMVKLRHTKISDSMDVLMQMKSPMGRVFANEDTNTIIMIDVPEKVDAMLSLVEAIDVEIISKKFNPDNKITADLMKRIESVLTGEIGKVDYNGDDNTVTVHDTEVRIEEIGKIIKTFEDSYRIVEFDLKIIQIVLNDEHIDGVDWEAIVSDYKSLDFIRSKGKKAVEQSLSLGTVIDEDYIVLQEALDTVGEIFTLRDDLSLDSKNNEFGFELKLSRVIDNIDEDLNKQENAVQLADSGKDEERIEFFLLSEYKKADNRDVLEIEFYPESDFSGISSDQINVDGLESKRKDMLLKRIIKKPFNKVVSLGRTIKNATWAKGECKDGSCIESVGDQKPALIECLSGSTLVVGGLFKSVDFESRKRIPFLGKIPMVGSAFTRQGVRQKKSEIILFITPKVNNKGL